MNQRFKLTIVLAGALGLLAGCQTQRNTVEHDAMFHWNDKSRIAAKVSPQQLSTQAMDPKVTSSDRRLCVGQLFATYVKPGCTSKDVRDALPDPRWLDSCRLESAGALGGALLVYVDFKTEVPFCLTIFPDEKGWSPWVIYLVFRVPRKPMRDEGARAFLTGEIHDDAYKLSEFVIHCPVPYDDERPDAVHVAERFTERGAGLKILPW